MILEEMCTLLEHERIVYPVDKELSSAHSDTLEVLEPRYLKEASSLIATEAGTTSEVAKVDMLEAVRRRYQPSIKPGVLYGQQKAYLERVAEECSYVQDSDCAGIAGHIKANDLLRQEIADVQEQLFEKRIEHIGYAQCLDRERRICEQRIATLQAEVSFVSRIETSNQHLYAQQIRG